MSDVTPGMALLVVFVAWAILLAVVVTQVLGDVNDDQDDE